MRPRRLHRHAWAAAALFAALRLLAWDSAAAGFAQVASDPAAVGFEQAPPAAAQAATTLDLARWEGEIAAFERVDREAPPPEGGVLFIGSSSIRLWKTLQQDFPGVPVLNRGFGGSQIREVTAFADRIVLPYRPRLIVFYCGANDIATGRSVRQVTGDFEAFAARVWSALPATRIAIISAAPNPARWHLRDEFRALNAHMAARAAADSRLVFIDVWPHMLGPAGTPRPELFVEDRLHMNEEGYALWARIIRPYVEEAGDERAPAAPRVR